MTTPMRSRTQFWLAAAIFLGPFIGAVVIYHWFPEWLPEGRTNYGTLVDPPKPVPALSLIDAAGNPVAAADLRRQWNLVYLATDACDAECRDRLHFGRQLWLALNEKRVKLQRWYIAPSQSAVTVAKSALAAENPDLRWVAGASDALREFMQAPSPQALYVIDPFGNWIMTYVPKPGADGLQRDFKGMQKDLNKLLKL